jgi:hypothetical protein
MNLDFFSFLFVAPLLFIFNIFLVVLIVYFVVKFIKKIWKSI